MLAALDVHTAKWVVNEALTGDLVKGRTVLLVTHSIALAAPIADYALVLGRNGKVASHGDVAEVLQRNSRLRSQMEKERLEIGEDVETKLEETTKDDSKNTDASKKTAGKLVVAEEKAMGRVNSAAVMLFIGSMGGPLVWTGIIGAFWFSILVMIFQGWFLGYWSNQYTLRDPSDVPTMKYDLFTVSVAIILLIFDEVFNHICCGKSYGPYHRCPCSGVLGAEEYKGIEEHSRKATDQHLYVYV